MGDLSIDTLVRGTEGRYTATLSPDWEVWGPNGGYLSAVALRAAGDSTALRRPTSYACHFLNVASFGDVQIDVQPLRSSKRAESLRVTMRQDDRKILEAMVWATDPADGPEHDATLMPDAGRPEHATLWTTDDPEKAPFPLWLNLEGRMVGWPQGQRWEDRIGGAPERLDWFRFKPRPLFDDPFVDAARALVLIDTMMFPAAALAHPEPMNFVAPSLDLSVRFHAPSTNSEWLLCEARSPVAADGLVAGTARVWTQAGALVASGGQQMLARTFG